MSGIRKDDKMILYYLLLGIINVVVIVSFCISLSFLTLILTDLIAIAWENVVEVMENVFCPIGEWVSIVINTLFDKLHIILQNISEQKCKRNKRKENAKGN